MTLSRQFETILRPTSEANPRNNEGDIIELHPGHLFLAYSYFYGGGNDESAAEIRGAFSADGGRSWSRDHSVQKNIGSCNVMCTNLLRLKDGRVALVFAVKNGQEPGDFDCRPYIVYSRDDCETWTKPEAICADANRYYVIENSRLIQLSSGRILVPIGLLVDTHPWWNVGCCAYSDDSGATWKISEFAAARDYPSQGFVETCAFEIDPTRRSFPGGDGSPAVMMYARTCNGQILHSVSTNGGITWSEPAPLGPKSPASPCLVKRIPSTGDILLIWNAVDRRQALPEWRSPLTTAISKDEGQTWVHVRDLEADTTTTYCYPSVTFTHDDHALVTYYVGERVGGRHFNLRALKLNIVPVKWLYS